MNKKDTKRNNIVKYRRPLNINVGLIIFGVIFVYIIICVVMYFRSSKIAGYEVREGSLAVSSTYEAFAVRDEEVIYTNYSGYINFYNRECERVGANRLIYTIDEANRLLEYTQKEDGAKITDDEMTYIKNLIIKYQNNYNDERYNYVYHFKSGIENNLFKLMNYSKTTDIEKLKLNESDGIHLGYADKSGIISYCVDGYETLTLEGINKDLFDKKNYKRGTIDNGSVVNAGEPAYKMCNDERWYLVVKLNNEQAALYENLIREYETKKKEANPNALIDSYKITIEFMETQTKSVAGLTLLYKQDGTYGILELNDSMMQFASERYIPINIETDEDIGLKIPLSSIVEKEFYMIPKDYLTKGGKNSKNGVNRLAYTEEGEMTSEFVEVTVYAEEAEEYYIDQNALRIGDIILLNNSVEQYTITKSGTLEGVYNMNKGYADFRQIIILYQNDEYAIVKSNTKYGLIMYDYIVLNADTVKDDDFIY